MDTPADLSPEEFKQLFQLAKRVLWTNHDTRRRLQGKGINIVPANFYSEIPTHDELDASFEYAEEVPFDSPMFDPKPLEAFAREHLAPYAPGFNPPKDNPHAPEIKEFFWSCPAFSSTDAIAYYTMIRNLKPKRILEIGSGYSTLVALEAVRQNGFGEVICIEPFPRDWLRALPIELIEQKVQTLDSQFFQEQLDDGDILFIDSTHAVKNGSDVLHLYLRVLPFLTRKLAVHVHDIYLPYPLPYRSATETQIYWTEQYLLYAYLLDNPKTRLLWSGVLGTKAYPDTLKEMMAGKMPIGGSSIWFSLNDVAFPAPSAAAVPAQATISTPATAPAGKRIDVGQVNLALEDSRIPEKTGEALVRGRYEFKEREIARRMLGKGDRVIELGAGMGVVSLTIARLVGADAIQSFEANPVIVELARENAAANDLPVTFRHAIASPRVVADETPHIDFFVLKSFEASSTRQVSPGQTSVQVPTTPLEQEIAAFGANALVFDIEGFETEIIEKTELSGIEKLILEIHPKIIGMDTCVSLINRLEAQGLILRADLAFGDVLAFQRGANPTSMGGGVLFEMLNQLEVAAQAGDWIRAMEIFTSLEESQSENAYTQWRVSLIERGLGRDGLVRAEKAEALGSQDFLLFADLAGLYLGQGDKPKAQAALQTLEQLFPRSPNLPALAQRIAAMA
jgi:FkbM family methyltransferase